MPIPVRSKSFSLSREVGVASPLGGRCWPGKFLDNGLKDRYVHLSGGLACIAVSFPQLRFFFSYHFAWGSTYGLST